MDSNNIQTDANPFTLTEEEKKRLQELASDLSSTEVTKSDAAVFNPANEKSRSHLKPLSSGEVTKTDAGVFNPRYAELQSGHLFTTQPSGPIIPELILNKCFKELPNQIRNEWEYPRNGTDPALVIIFNNQTYDNPCLDRVGSEIDVREIARAFGKIGINVRKEHIFNDFSKVQIINALDDILKSKKLEDRNSVILVFLAHGISDNLLIPSDESNLHVNEITRKFGECEYLKGKPKLFLFQACKGDDVTDKNKVPDKIESLIPRDTYNIIGDPLHEDMIIAYSTVEGKRAMRDTTKGTWFIQEFCRNVATYGKEEDVLSLVTRTQKCVANNYYYYDIYTENLIKQMPMYVSTLKKKFYLTRTKGRNSLLHILENYKSEIKIAEEILNNLRRRN